MIFGQHTDQLRSGNHDTVCVAKDRPGMLTEARLI